MWTVVAKSTKGAETPICVQCSCISIYWRLHLRGAFATLTFWYWCSFGTCHLFLILEAFYWNRLQFSIPRMMSYVKLLSLVLFLYGLSLPFLKYAAICSQALSVPSIEYWRIQWPRYGCCTLWSTSMSSLVWVNAWIE